MNEKSSFRGKDNLIEDDDFIKSTNTKPMFSGQTNGREDTLIFKVYIPKEKKIEQMSFHRNRKKKDKDKTNKDKNY